MIDRTQIQKDLQLGSLAARKIAGITLPGSRILDIGGGGGQHSLFFSDLGFDVTYNDFKRSENLTDDIRCITGNFNDLFFPVKFDIVWASHVLEHQPNVNEFLRKVKFVTEDDGLIAITVPPAKGQIVSGHFSIWNSGLLLYNLVMAGLDCRNASVLQYGYNISVIVRKKEIELPDLNYDYGDLTRLKEFFPSDLQWADDSFNGDVSEINWGIW